MVSVVLLCAAILFETQQGGVGLTIAGEKDPINPAQSVFLRVEVKTPRGKTATPPDLRNRVKGFSLAEDFAEEPVTDKTGATIQVVNWRLVPEPCAAEYKIRPFVVEVDGGKGSFVGGPVEFEPPAAREPVTGAMEVDLQKDLPPLSWKLVGWIVGALVATGLAACGLWLLIRFFARKVKEHRMSPIERAWVELDRLLKKGLPGRGRYKDFYVELTMVVRRYIQRQHGVVAPHLTTEEFFEVTRHASSFPKSTLDELIDFLRKSDMVKFAGVEATPQTAEEATESARAYIEKDDVVIKRRVKQSRTACVVSQIVKEQK